MNPKALNIFSHWTCCPLKLNGMNNDAGDTKHELDNAISSLKQIKCADGYLAE